jgi:hypothetical protein
MPGIRAHRVRDAHYSQLLSIIHVDAEPLAVRGFASAMSWVEPGPNPFETRVLAMSPD